jgi:signal transduction histidine kinase
MNRHRGVLTIDSSVGLGSVFTAYLPVREAAAETAPPSPQRLENPA